jgi:hypothetical protein
MNKIIWILSKNIIQLSLFNHTIFFTFTTLLLIVDHSILIDYFEVRGSDEIKVVLRYENMK